MPFIDDVPQCLHRYDVGFPSAKAPGQKQTCIKRISKEERSMMEFLLFTVRAELKRSLFIRKDRSNPVLDRNLETHEYETTYTVYPTAWLIRLGVRLGLRLTNLSSSIRGWKYTLETFRPVPDSALIFRLCKSGNVTAVRKLLAEGNASVKDTDSFGYTPLHVSALLFMLPWVRQKIDRWTKFAARSHHLELCKFLKGAGADTHAITHIYG